MHICLYDANKEITTYVGQNEEAKLFPAELSFILTKKSD